MGNSGTSEILKICWYYYNEFDTPKPEGLLKQIVALATVENDIVLDFFMGSATTLAVAMKMNRKFIGIEQMDYIQHSIYSHVFKKLLRVSKVESPKKSIGKAEEVLCAELMEKNSGFLKSIYLLAQ